MGSTPLSHSNASFFELLFAGLEANDFSKQQRMILRVKFLGELYNYYIIQDSQVVFDLLGLIMNYGHRPPTIPANASQNHIKVIQKQFTEKQHRLDPPNDYFRIHLICSLLGYFFFIFFFLTFSSSPLSFLFFYYFFFILLFLSLSFLLFFLLSQTSYFIEKTDTTAEYFDSAVEKLKLKCFILYFQRYILSKERLPMSVDFMVSDCYENLPIDVNRFGSLQEVCSEIAKLDEKLIQKNVSHNFSPTFDPTEKPYETLVSQSEAASEETSKGTSQDQKENQDQNREDNDSDSQKGNSSESDSDSDSTEESKDSSDSTEEDDLEESGKEEEDPEFTEVQFKPSSGQPNNQKAEDEDEFDQLFTQVLKESTESRKQESRYIGQKVDLTIPLSLMNKPASEPQQNNFVGVKLLVKKGSKPSTKELAIPNESKLVKKHRYQEEESKEKQENIRLVLEFDEKEREKEAMGFEGHDHEEPTQIVQPKIKSKQRRF